MLDFGEKELASKVTSACLVLGSGLRRKDQQEGNERQGTGEPRGSDHKKKLKIGAWWGRLRVQC